MNEFAPFQRGVMPECSAIDDLNAIFDAYERRMARRVVALRVLQALSFSVAIFALFPAG